MNVSLYPRSSQAGCLLLPLPAGVAREERSPGRSSHIPEFGACGVEVVERRLHARRYRQLLFHVRAPKASNVSVVNPGSPQVTASLCAELRHA